MSGQADYRIVLIWTGVALVLAFSFVYWTAQIHAAPTACSLEIQP